jgi:uncharacterized membrane protein
MLTAGRRDGELSPMVVATFVVLLAAFGLQLVAYGSGGHSAISDLPRVFLHRGVGPGALPYLQRPIEYPVVAGWLLYVASLVSPTPLGVLTVTAFVAGALALLITTMLERRFGARAWRWALALPVLLYAFQNWDLFAVAALVVGLLAFERGHDRAAGVAFGIGAAIKLFPAVVVPPLVVVRWIRGDRAGARRLALSAVAVFVACNLPVALANPSGWWWPFAFQSRRAATWGSGWFYAFRSLGLPVHGATGAHLANVISMIALVGGLGWLLFVTVERRLEPFATAAAAVAIFVLCNKVYSPTYDVWLVVFFVMLPLSRRLWVAFCAVDLAVFATVYGYFGGIDSVGFVRIVLPVLVVTRTVVLLSLVATATRRPTVSSTPSPIREPMRSP